MFAVGTLSLTNTSFLWDVQLLPAFAPLLTTPYWSGFPPWPPACIAMPQCFSGRSLPNASSHLSCKQHTRWNCQVFLFLRIDLWWKHGRITHQDAWESFMENSVWLHNGHIRVEGELGGGGETGERLLPSVWSEVWKSSCISSMKLQSNYQMVFPWTWHRSTGPKCHFPTQRSEENRAKNTRVARGTQVLPPLRTLDSNAQGCRANTARERQGALVCRIFVNSGEVRTRV